MNLKEVFSKINSFPWEKTRCLIGDGQHLAEALRGIVSSEESDRDACYRKLDNHVVVQGGVFNSSFYCIPFLIALFRNEETEGKDKGRLLDILFEIANGSSDELICYETVIDGDFKYFVPSENTEAVPLQMACRSMIQENVSHFLRDIKNNQSKTRYFSLTILLSFYEHRFFVTSFLKEVLKGEKDQAFAAELEKGVKEFNGLLNPF